MKILFVLKDRYYNHSLTKSYGLMNSANQVAEYLEKLGHECKLVQVIDGNYIDREVYQYKPDIVIIEALWVTSDKMKELLNIKRYQNIIWIVRIHSDIGFLSAETMAIRFINEYIELNDKRLKIALNNFEFKQYFSNALSEKFLYLPNIITVHNKNNNRHKHKTHIDIASFGSLRILKNQCFQALCAIAFADRLGKILHFHITADLNVENSNKASVLRNLEQIFKNSKHELIIHEWMTHDDFEELIKKMDMGMQLSFTESFNIVTADFVNNNVPIIVSNSIDWMPNFFKTSTTDYSDVVLKMKKIYRFRKCKLLKIIPKIYLNRYNISAKLQWYNFMKKLETKVKN